MFGQERALKLYDIIDLSKLYEAEFNKADLHDRILIFDVVASPPTGNTAENSAEKERNAKDVVDNEASKQSKDGNDDLQSTGNAASNETNDGPTIAATNEKETVLPHHKGNTQIEWHHVKISTNGSETSLVHNEETSYDKASSKGKIIRQHKFYIHSSWLALQSSYFRSLLFSEMKESRANEVHVKILANDEKAHLTMLEAMYKPTTLDNACVDELLDVLRLAHKYDVKFVLKKCKYCLKAMAITVEICNKIMHFIKVEGIITDFDDLVQLLQSFLAKEFSPLDTNWPTTSFKELCEPSIQYLFSSNKLVVESENTVFHALMHWIEHHGIENVLERKELPSLLSVIRFEQLTADYLYNNVQHHAIAKQLPDFTDHYLRGISYHALSNDIKAHLPKQPMVRPKTQSVNAYKWDIPSDELHSLVGTQNELKSDEFWFCGYRMGLTISDVVHDEKVQEFGAKLSLEVMGLTECSIVDVLWRPFSQSVLFGCDTKKEKFTKSAPVSSVNIKYRSEEKRHNSQNKSSPITPLFALSKTATTLPENPGFNFTAPKTTESTTLPENPGFNFTAPKTTESTTLHGSSGFTFSSPKPTESTRLHASSGFTFSPKTTESTTLPASPGFQFSSPTTTTPTLFSSPGINTTSPKKTSPATLFSSPGLSTTSPKKTSPATLFSSPGLSTTSPKKTSPATLFSSPGLSTTSPKKTSPATLFSCPGLSTTSPKKTSPATLFSCPGLSTTSPKKTSPATLFSSPGLSTTSTKTTKSTTFFVSPGLNTTSPKTTESTTLHASSRLNTTSPKTTAPATLFSPGLITTSPETTASIRGSIPTDNPRTNKLPNENCLSIEIKMKLGI